MSAKIRCYDSAPRLPQRSKHLETIKNRTLPLPVKALLDLEPAGEIVSRLQKIEIKSCEPVEEIPFECLDQKQRSRCPPQ